MEISMSKKKVAVTAAVLATVLTAFGVTMHASAAIKVHSHSVSPDSIAKIAEINGNVVSDETVSRYSVIEGRITDVKVKVGDYVKKGDTIITYDVDDLDRRIELADYSMKEAFGGYDSIIQTAGRSAGLYSEAKTTLKGLDEQITATQTAINDCTRRLTQKRASIADLGAKLQISVVDWSDHPDSDTQHHQSSDDVNYQL